MSADNDKTSSSKPRIKVTNGQPIAAGQGVRKAQNSTPKKGVGTSGMAFYQQLIEQIQPYELQWPQSMRTFEAMKNDDAIATVLKLTYNLIESAFANKKIKYNKDNPESKRAADFLEYCLENLDSSTFMQAIKGIATFKEKGFSIEEKIYKQEFDGEYADYFRLSDLGFRPQISLDKSTPFETGVGGRKLLAIRQNTQAFQNKTQNNLFIDPIDMTGKGYKRIARKKFLLFGENATDSTPFGTPLLRSCYKVWKEKLLLEDLEINGASKDLAGIIELAIPAEILNKAASDPSSDEAIMVDTLIQQASNVHNGMQSSIIRPSDLQAGSSSVTEYSTRLLGIEGGGKAFSVSEMIQQRRKAIFDIWGAGHTLTGEGSVSYNSAEVQNAIHLHYIKADIQVIEDVLNKDLIPQLINVMNEHKFNLSYNDLPKIKAGDVDKLSWDEISKFGQRLGAVGYLPKTAELINELLEKAGLETRLDENASQEEIASVLGDNESRSGDGMTSGLGNGTGNSTSSGGDRSSMNSDNAA